MSFILLIPLAPHVEDLDEGLLTAAGKGHTATVQALLDQGEDVNARDEDHTTALIYVALGGHMGTVRVLLDRGAAVNAKNKDGLTALMIATYNGYTPIIQASRRDG